MGDGCESFKKNVENSEECQENISKARSRGSKILVKNLKHAGHSGEIINFARSNSSGKYFVFFDNDDMILPNHFENYINAIEQGDADYAFVETKLETPMFAGRIRKVTPPLECGDVGHSELIVKNSIQKELPLHESEYGHDWVFINNLSKFSQKVNFSDNPFSYIVRHIPGQGSYDEWD